MPPCQKITPPPNAEHPGKRGGDPSSRCTSLAMVEEGCAKICHAHGRWFIESGSPSQGWDLIRDTDFCKRNTQFAVSCIRAWMPMRSATKAIRPLEKYGILRAQSLNRPLPRRLPTWRAPQAAITPMLTSEIASPRLKLATMTAPSVNRFRCKQIINMVTDAGQGTRPPVKPNIAICPVVTFCPTKRRLMSSAWARSCAS